MRPYGWSVVALCSSLVACGSEADVAHFTADSLLREELLQRGQADQAVRNRWMENLQRGEQPDSADFVATYLTDSANTEWLKHAVREHGWPNRSRVGDEAAKAAFLIVQHSADTAFQREMLLHIRRAFTAGEVEGQQLALLTDRVEVTAGRPQVYGTQARISDNRVILYPIVDSTRVDERRAEIGMMPLADYLRLLDSVYTARDGAS